MKLITSALACMCILGCSRQDSSNASPPGPLPAATSFVGLEIGSSNTMPECARYTPDGDYQVASLQPVTPCFIPPLNEVVAIDGVEVKRPADFPKNIAILFRAEQVPAGIDTRAAGIIQAGRLAEVAVEQSADASYDDRKAFIPLLSKKYGQLAGFTSERDVYWHQPNMDVIYYPAPMPYKVRIVARSTSYKEWLQRSAPAPQKPGTF
ncbi:hypothetical protein ABQ137_07935 [Xanthomonas sp. WHRI 8393]|uniref:hypothetical protein n=1 Tax=Xanthomonas sp. WHRI 8393 TaxID=3161574 RepID=UPI0032E91A17